MKFNRLLVTGGNGHVGNTLAKKLCEKGYDVRVTVRDPDEAQAFGIFDGYPVQVHRADIRDAAAEPRGIDFVTKLGVERVVLTSSIAAVGFGGSEQRPLTEADWGAPADPYCRSKLQSEQAAWAYATEHGVDLVALCPGIVLGPNFYKHTPSTVNVGALVNNQVPFRVPIGLAAVDVRDVADAHILAYENSKDSGRYLVTGTRIPDLFAALSECDPEMVMPQRTLSTDEARQLAAKSGMPAELVGQPYRYSDERIRRELGWQPRPVAATLADTIAWIKSRDL